MQDWITSGLLVALVSVLAGCGGGTTSSGVFEVAITEEELETLSGNRCAVRGNATNVGNVRARVRLRYEARSATGVVIGVSTASFQVAPFSNFEFRNSKPNQDGQPSSTVFSNGLACAGISNFRRVETDVDNA